MEMKAPKYQVGQEVWVALTSTERAMEVCKDCLGKCYLTVILGDGSHVKVDCRGCEHGWQGCLGHNEYYKHTSKPVKTILNKMEFKNGKWEYGSEVSYSHEEEEVFLTEEEAQSRAELLAEERTREEIRSLQYKYNDKKSWAWNASYHRRQIRQAEKDIEFHSKKLGYALVKAKEEAA